MRCFHLAYLRVAHLLRETQVVQALLLADAEVNTSDAAGYTPLHKACENGRDGAVLMLLNMHAQPLIATRDGTTPLHLVAEHGHSAIVSLLVPRLINTPDPRGIMQHFGPKCKTPLHLAVEGGHERVVMQLLEAHADAGARDCNGLTPLALARQHRHLVIARYLSALNSATLSVSRRSSKAEQVGRGSLALTGQQFASLRSVVNMGEEREGIRESISSILTQ